MRSAPTLLSLLVIGLCFGCSNEPGDDDLPGDPTATPTPQMDDDDASPGDDDASPSDDDASPGDDDASSEPTPSACEPEPEICIDGVDNDCDGSVDEYEDEDKDGTADCYDDDGDGYTETQGDCDDGNASVYPGHTESCNGIDSDCDGIIDNLTWYRDADGDSYGSPNESVVQCDKPEGYVPRADDCDDSNETILGPRVWYRDADGDTYGWFDPATLIEACEAPEGYVPNDLDCNDANPDRHPGVDAVDRCLPITTIHRRMVARNYCDVAADGGDWCTDTDGVPGADRLGNPRDPLTHGRRTYDHVTGELWLHRTLSDGNAEPPPYQDYAQDWSNALSVARIAHISDTHLFDVWTPLHLGEWDQIVNSALHLTDSYTCMTSEAIVRTINRFNEQDPIDFTIATGDLANNGQKNELSWFIDIMRGGATIQCNSQNPEEDVIPDRFDRFDPFKPEGLAMPWLITPGNHDRGFDGLGVSTDVSQGNAAEYLQNILIFAFGTSRDDYYLTAYLGPKFNDDVDGYRNVGDMWYYPESQWIQLCLDANPSEKDVLCDPENDMRSQWASGILGKSECGGYGSNEAVNYPYVDFSWCGYDAEACYVFNVYMDYYDYPTAQMTNTDGDNDPDVFYADINGDGVTGDVVGPVSCNEERKMLNSRSWMDAFVQDCLENDEEDGCHGLSQENVNNLNIINEDPNACDTDELNDGDFDSIECEYSGEYVKDPIPGLPLRLIAIDTTSRMLFEGISEGQIRRPTMEWIKRQIAEAADEGELVILASHHPTASLIDSGTESSMAQAIAGSPYEYITYDKADEETGTPEINEFVEELLEPYSHTVNGETHTHRLYENVIAHLAGHQHRNRVDAHPADCVTLLDDGSYVTQPDLCGWWEIAAPSLIDSPLMMRHIELVAFPDDPSRLQIVVTSVDYEVLEDSDLELTEEMAEARRLSMLDAGPDSLYQGPYITEENYPGGFAAHGQGSSVERNVVLEVTIPSDIGESIIEYARNRSDHTVAAGQFVLPN